MINPSDLELIFEDWCLWNIKKLSIKEFICRYEISPQIFRKQYWNKGLFEFWDIFIKGK